MKYPLLLAVLSAIPSALPKAVVGNHLDQYEGPNCDGKKLAHLNVAQSVKFYDNVQVDVVPGARSVFAHPADDWLTMYGCYDKACKKLWNLYKQCNPFPPNKWEKNPDSLPTEALLITAL
ncbi:MAG: hypothetical protein Q9227_005475 [Pyrenula ochraceoflavens]